MIFSYYGRVVFGYGGDGDPKKKGKVQYFKPKQSFEFATVKRGPGGARIVRVK